MSIININNPRNNLKRQLALLDSKIATDYKRVKASKNTDRTYDSKVKEFLQDYYVLRPIDATPRLVTIYKVFKVLYYCAYRGKKELM